VLCVTAEARRFWGINNFISISGFSLCGVLQFLIAGKVTFDVEKVSKFLLRSFALLRNQMFQHRPATHDNVDNRLTYLLFATIHCGPNRSE